MTVEGGRVIVVKDPEIDVVTVDAGRVVVNDKSTVDTKNIILASGSWRRASIKDKPEMSVSVEA